MFRITLELLVHADDEQNCKTVARKALQAVEAAIRSAPYPIQARMSAVKLTPPSPIIQPGQTPSSLVLPPSATS